MRHFKCLTDLKCLKIFYQIINKHTNWFNFIYNLTNNINLLYKIKEGRLGDLDTVYCNCDKANKELLWYAKKSIENICEDSYNFVKNTN